MLAESLPLSRITPLNYCTSAKGVFDDTTSQQMHDAMSAYAKVCTQKSLALFFHGGLVDKASGMQNAQQLFGPYSAQSDSNDKGGNAYPYFFVWESGLLETLQHNLPGIVAETIFERLRDIVGSKARAVLTGSPANEIQAVSLRAPTADDQIPGPLPNAQASQNDIDDVQRAVENDPFINAEKRRIAQTARPVRQALAESLDTTPRAVRTSPVTLLSPEIVNAIAAEEAHKDAITPKSSDLLWNPISLGSLALGAGKVLVRIVQRYATGRNHNFHNTVMEEIFRQFYVANIGWAIWNEMKLETTEAFQGDAQRNVGTTMIQELVQLYESGENGKNARVTLLGHSTGAVYICNFLAAIAAALQDKDYANRIQFDVIFMAPAVRVDVLANTLASYGMLIRNFRSFEMSDIFESSEILLQLNNASPAVNALFAQIYTSSLLYFISGVLEDDDDDTPIDGMQRFFEGTGAFAAGKIAAIDSVQEAYSRFKGPAIVYSDTSEDNPQPPLGQRCTSYHHGGFPSDDAKSPIGGTLQSVCYLLKTGNY